MEIVKNSLLAKCREAGFVGSLMQIADYVQIINRFRGRWLQVL
jgi:hypothetical protein